MIKLLSGMIAPITSLLKKVQVKQFLAVCMIGVVLLVTQAQPERQNRALTNAVKDAVHQDDSDRPKTTGEWKQEARETAGAPAERLQRIAGEAADAVKDWGEVYPDVAERSIPALRDEADTANLRGRR